jgi:hypothetical protein
MSTISFNEQTNKTKNTRTPRTFGDKLIAWGIVKTKNQANIVLIAVAIIGIAITIYNISSLQKETTTTGTPELIIPN